MKFGYRGADLGELVSHYEISDDEIEVTFLDGSKANIPFTEENETKLLEYMIEQAEERRDNSKIYNVEGKLKRESIIDLSFYLPVIAVSVYAMSRALHYDVQSRLIYETVYATACFNFGLSLYSEEKKRYEKYSELEKYDIYLAIREKLEEADDIRVFNGVKMTDNVLNINTLDNYSVKDMKKIRENLIELEEDFSETSIKTKQFVKKI